LGYNKLWKKTGAELCKIITGLKGTKVHTLDLIYNDLGDNKTGAELCSIMSALKGTNVHTLYLSGNKLWQKTGAELCAMIAELRDTKVHTLDLSYNGVWEKTGAELCSIMSALKDTNVRTLDLRTDILCYKTVEELQLCFRVLKATQVNKLTLSSRSLPINDLNKLNALEGALPNIQTLFLDYSGVSVLPHENKVAINAIFPKLEKIIFPEIRNIEPTVTKAYNDALSLGFPHPFPTLLSLASELAKTEFPEMNHCSAGEEMVLYIIAAAEEPLKAEEERQKEEIKHAKNNTIQAVSEYIKKRPKGFYYYFSKIFSFLSNRAQRRSLAETLLANIRRIPESDENSKNQLLNEALRKYQTSVLNSRHWCERQSHQGCSETMITELLNPPRESSSRLKAQNRG
jgi:hypothetical protein